MPEQTKEARIMKIQLKLGDKTVMMSIEDAKRLHGVLDELFRKEIIKEVIRERYHDWWWNYPKITYLTDTLYTGTPPTIDPYQITCQYNMVNIDMTDSNC